MARKKAKNPDPVVDVAKSFDGVDLETFIHGTR
jgi:hypothetical protein